MMKVRRTIDLIYVDSGGGHRAAAIALADAIREQRLPWEVRLWRSQDLLARVDFIRQYTGIDFGEIYNILLRKGWTAWSEQLIALAHLFIRRSHGTQVRALERHWEEHRPDLVVSLIPHFNRAFKESLERVWPGTPFVTAMTDIADYPPHFWIERQDQWVICGSERAAAQAREIGLAEWRILRTSGMILNPKFYAPLNVDRAAERTRLGLRPDLPTGLVLFGGEGSMKIVEVARRLNRPDLGIQLIVICGRHAKAERRVRALDRRIPMHIEGFTREVRRLMALSDFFIGKPGPGAISEALAMGLPVIVEKNFLTFAHERYNADWVVEQGAGVALRSFSRIANAVGALLDPGRFESYRQRAAALRNRAVFEIPGMLAGILEDNTGGASVVETIAGARAR